MEPLWIQPFQTPPYLERASAYWKAKSEASSVLVRTVSKLYFVALAAIFAVLETARAIFQGTLNGGIRVLNQGHQFLVEHRPPSRAVPLPSVNSSQQMTVTPPPPISPTNTPPRLPNPPPSPIHALPEQQPPPREPVAVRREERQPVLPQNPQITPPPVQREGASPPIAAQLPPPPPPLDSPPLEATALPPPRSIPAPEPNSFMDRWIRGGNWIHNNMWKPGKEHTNQAITYSKDKGRKVFNWSKETGVQVKNKAVNWGTRATNRVVKFLDDYGGHQFLERPTGQERQNGNE